MVTRMHDKVQGDEAIERWTQLDSQVPRVRQFRTASPPCMTKARNFGVYGLHPEGPNLFRLLVGPSQWLGMLSQSIIARREGARGGAGGVGMVAPVGQQAAGSADQNRPRHVNHGERAP